MKQKKTHMDKLLLNVYHMQDFTIGLGFLGSHNVIKDMGLYV